MTEGIWQLEATGPTADIYAAAETLGFLEDMNALSLSVFDIDPTTARLEAGYATEAGATAARDHSGLSATILSTTIRHLPPHDWVSEVQAGLAPVRAGRFTLHGAHDRDSAKGDVLIEVEAGPAFGSGHHPTTRGCLEVFSDLLDAGFAPATVLDVGCGTGVLAIAAALTTGAEVTATDIDPDAVEVTRATAALNRAELTTFQANGLSDPRIATSDLVFANILASPLKSLAPDMEKATANGGLLILSGLLNEQAEDVLAAYTATGLRERRRHTIEEWTTLLLQKS